MTKPKRDTTADGNMGDASADKTVPLERKIDRITALQDGIDSLSLAMFEALRGLRDAVAPESGNLGGNASAVNGNTTEENSQPDFDDLMQSYRNGDTATMELVQRANHGVAPTKREDFIRIYAKLEMEKDDKLVKRLAGTVLEKSADIDAQVSELPGMHRTKSEQMAYIEQLLRLNQEASEALEQAYVEAQKRRDLVRKYVRDTTCEALGIVEDTD